MAKVSPLQANLNGGEISPLMAGRVDFDKYKTSLKTSLNGFGLVQGPWTRRPGTKFVREVKTSAKKTRVMRFVFSTTQAYILEFGDLYFRAYKDHGVVLDGTDPVEVVTPYTEDEIFQLKITQSADVLYVAHPSHKRRKISRTSHTAWTVTTIADNDGPYLTTNATATTLTLSGTTGSVTVTASAVTGINGGAGFRATDVGRLIRWKDPAGNWTWLEITAQTDTLNVTATIKGADASASTATANWRLGLWNDTDGYPAAVTFYEDRLAWGTVDRVDASRTGDYENMAPSDPDGTVVDDHAISYTLRSNDVQVIRWMGDDEKGLVIGTVAGEWIMRPSSQNEALTPTNVNAKQSTSEGSADIAAVRAGKALLFVQSAGRELHEIAYVYEVDGFRSPDMTILAEHITRGGIVETAFQKKPHSIVWAVRADGTLLSFVYNRDQNVVGWHRHELGGSGLVESVASIPAPDGTRDEVWLVVKRTINGSTVRYVEYMEKAWEEGDDQEDAFYVDCGLTYDDAAATTIDGLDHLEGETVTILADGATHPTRTVSDGSITLARSASTVQIGYGYNSDGQLSRPEAGAADGTAQGKTQRTHRIAFRLDNTLGLRVGKEFGNSMERIVFRTSADDLGAPPPLYTGDKSFTWEGDYTTDNYVCWRFDQPLPGTIVAVMPQLATQDR